LVDAGGRLVGCLSLSDVRGVDGRSAAALASSAAELAAASAAGRPAWDPAAAPFGERVAGAAAGDWGAVLAAAPPVCVAADATLGDVVTAVAGGRGVHRAFVVDGGGAPVGVVELNDVLSHRRGEEAEEFARQIRDYFDTVYEEGAEQGRVMCIALHPYWVGQPHRIRAVRAALEYVLSHSGVWLARGAEIVDWYNMHHLPLIESHLAAREASNG
jgi:CBS domain-containing protein